MSSKRPMGRRVKVTIACDECRARKVKCDGTQPVCLPCRQRYGSNVPCTWPQDARSKRAHDSKRVHELEEQVKAMEQSGILNASQAREAVGTSGSTTPATQLSTEAPNRFRSADLVKEKLSRATSFGPTGAIVDETLGRAKNRGYFGPSSIARFLAQIHTQVTSEEDRQPTSNIPETPSILGLHSKKPSVGPLIPSKKLADSLLERYWKYVHPFNPVLDRSDVELAYRKLWTERWAEDSSIGFLCTINMIFALSSNNEDLNEDDSEQIFSCYFVRACDLLCYDLWETGSFLALQTFLLISIYLRINEPHQAWIASSLAIRTAQALGMHQPEMSARISSPRARELVRKVWYTCISIDRILSMTYGRPTLVDKEMAIWVPYPLPLDEQNIPIHSDFPLPVTQESPSEIEFFVQMMGLYKILDKVLLNLEMGGISYDSYREGYSTAKPDTRSLLELDSAVISWKKALPHHLTRPENSTNKMFQRQAVITHQRFLHVRLLLLRPALLSLVISSLHQAEVPETDMPFDIDRLSRQTTLSCAQAEVETAQEVIRFIEKWFDSDILWGPGSRNTWWYNVFFIYAAAVVLSAACVCSDLLQHVPEESIRTSYDNAVKLLKPYSQHSALAADLLDMVQGLYEKTRRSRVPSTAPEDMEVDSHINVPQHDIFDIDDVSQLFSVGPFQTEPPWDEYLSFRGGTPSPP